MPKLNIPQEAIDNYLKVIYDSWDQTKYTNQQFALSYEVGSSYIKIVSDHGQLMVHSFIVNKPGKFPLGTILKAAGWKAPATNFSRGNVLTKEYGNASWTGTT